MLSELKKLLQKKFPGADIVIQDVSHQHSRGSELSHINVFIVSELLEGLTLIKREKEIRVLVKDLGLNPHALSIRAQTPKEKLSVENKVKTFGCQSKK